MSSDWISEYISEEDEEITVEVLDRDTGEKFLVTYPVDTDWELEDWRWSEQNCEICGVY